MCMDDASQPSGSRLALLMRSIEARERVLGARLAANPIARRCTACQARHEKFYNDKS